MVLGSLGVNVRVVPDKASLQCGAAWRRECLNSFLLILIVVLRCAVKSSFLQDNVRTACKAIRR